MSLLTNIAPLHQALDYHLQRQTLLTANLAHVDTPGFRAQDLVRTSAGGFENALGVELRATASGHFGAHAGSSPWTVKVDTNAPLGPDGNTVSLDRESVKIASNNLRYDAISTMIRGRLEDLAFAARDGRS
ncbi:MAG: flagellar basal body rod protein FlgB [Myxococcales bacterium]|nr:flagellar basal body rod protein FlgB [Myxococcales bacterium]